MPRPVPDFADHQISFAPTRDSKNLPEGVTYRDLWDAFNRAYRDGIERSDPFGMGGTYFTLVADGLAIEAYRPSGREGSVYGLNIHVSDPWGGYIFTLENGIVVSWEECVNVHQLRGILY